MIRHSFGKTWNKTAARVPGAYEACLPVLFFLLLAISLGACRSQAHTSTPEPALGAPGFTPSSVLALSPSTTSTLTATITSTATLTPALGISFPKIDRSPRPVTIADWAPWAGRTLTATLDYDPTSPDLWQIDLRTQDLSRMDLRYAKNDLLAAASFDDRTIWPPSGKLPFGFDPQVILETGKNPGLGVRSLHARGITGTGVGIAIIDMPLLVDHQEYKDRLRLYEELYFHEEAYQQPASMHGAAVASFAVGRTVGVAPDADLYYIAVDLSTGQDASGNDQFDFTMAAQAVRRILEINRQLPSDRKIRLISMSFGWAAKFTGYDEISAAVAEARAAGVFVLSAYPAMQQIYGFKSTGLERPPLAGPDSFLSYSRTLVCDLYGAASPLCQPGSLLVPMNSRTAASPFGEDEYAFYRLGGEDWTIPYLAGMYALAVQADPEITPGRFWELALQTGRSVNITGTSGIYTLGPILDPVGLIQAVENK